MANGKQIDLPRNHSALQHMEHGKDKPYAIGLMESNQKFSANLQIFYVQISRAVHGMTLVTDDKEKLTQAIHKNTELKPASLDIVDSKRLEMHQQNFKSQQDNDFVIQQKIKNENLTKEL